MSNGQIHIDPMQLRDLAGRIRTCRTDTENCLNEATTEMNNLAENGWKSSAGSAIKERYDRLRNRYFANYPAAMEQYEQFLLNTASEYEQADERRKAEIDAMMNMGVQ